MRYSHFVEWSNMWGERNPLSIRKNPNMFYCWQRCGKCYCRRYLNVYLRALFFTGISHFYYKKAKVFAYTLEWQPANSFFTGVEKFLDKQIYVPRGGISMYSSQIRKWYYAIFRHLWLKPRNWNTNQYMSESFDTRKIVRAENITT